MYHNSWDTISATRAYWVIQWVVIYPIETAIQLINHYPLDKNNTTYTAWDLIQWIVLPNIILINWDQAEIINFQLCFLFVYKTKLWIMIQNGDTPTYIKHVNCIIRKRVHSFTSFDDTKNTLSSAWAWSTHFNSSTRKLMFLWRCWFFTCKKLNPLHWL